MRKARQLAPHGEENYQLSADGNTLEIVASSASPSEGSVYGHSARGQPQRD